MPLNCSMDLAELRRQIERFQPADEEENQVKQRLLGDLSQYGQALLERSLETIHLTASSLIVDPAFQQTLMVYHNIYQAVCWTGGHADGERDLLQVAIREAKEETGIQVLWPVTTEILSLDLLPVPAHKKRGKDVYAHQHYSIAFGLIAPLKQKLTVKPDENKQVKWLPISQIEEQCNEAHMLPVYRKILNQIQRKRKEQQFLYGKAAEILPTWFQKEGRELPWRKDKDPYHVWISEIMLQQTRIEAVIGYYQRFLNQFPTVQDLAEGDEAVLMKLWEGLGYYNRARNLQKAAKEIVNRYDGHFPENYEELLALPGIGSYTAGAIGSLCFEQPTPAVDGNVLRVLSRLTEDYESIDRQQKKKRIFSELQSIYPAGKCGLFTQGLMELGEVICIPNGKPKCESCPLSGICLAGKSGNWTGLPVRDEKKARRREERTVFLLQCGDRLALEKRPAKGLLAGLWQFPNIKGFLSPQEAVDWAEKQGVGPLPVTGSLRVLEKEHIFTHIHWYMRGYIIPCSQENGDFVWADENSRQQTYALPTAFRQFLDK